MRRGDGRTSVKICQPQTLLNQIEQAAHEKMPAGKDVTLKRNKISQASGTILARPEEIAGFRTHRV